MARIRTIKPEFPQSESMGRVSRDARLLFIQLWTIADDSGRLRGNSRMLASLLYPYDNDAGSLIESWLSELDHEGCIRRYKHDGDTYLEVVNWLKHRKIDKPSSSKHPPFDESSRIIANPLERSSEDQGSRKGMDQGEEEELKLVSPSAQSDPDGSHDTESEIIERLFDFYCESLKRSPKQYTLTPERRKKALARLRERRKLHGSLASAERDLAQAVENLAASEWHRTKGHVDWLDQIFRSAEEFEKRLNWKAPQIGAKDGANKRISPAAQRQQSSDDAIRKAAAFLEGTDSVDEPGARQLSSTGTNGRDRYSLVGGLV